MTKEADGFLASFFSEVFHSVSVRLNKIQGSGGALATTITASPFDMLPVPRCDLRKRAAAMFFMDFGDFPSDGAGPVRAETIRELLQGFDQPIGGFVEHHRPRFGGERVQPCQPAFLDRQETFEAEAVAGKAGRNEGGDAGGRAGKGLHLYSFCDAGSASKKPGSEMPGVPASLIKRHPARSGSGL